MYLRPLTCDVINNAITLNGLDAAQHTVNAINNSPRANAFSTDGGATFGPAVAVPELPMLARGMQGQVIGV